MRSYSPRLEQRTGRLPSLEEPRLIAALSAAVVLFGASCRGGGTETSDQPVDQVSGECRTQAPPCGQDDVQAGPSDVAPVTHPPTSPIADENCAVLEGDELGTLECSLDQFRRPLDLILDKPSADFELGVPYLALTRCDATSFWLMFQIRNVSDAPACFVKVHDLTLLGPSGAELTSPEDSYVDGRLRQLLPTLATQTCLAPGDAGFVVSFEIKGGADVKTVFVERIEADEDYGEQPPYLIRPTGYTVQKGGFASEMTVDIENQGTAPGWVGLLSQFVLLAKDDSPLFAGYLDRASTWNGLLAPAEKGTISSDTLTYPGTGAILWVSIDADTTEEKLDSIAFVPPSRSAFSTRDEWLYAVSHWRNDRCRAQEEQHRHHAHGL